MLCLTLAALVLVLRFLRSAPRLKSFPSGCPVPLLTELACLVSIFGLRRWEPQGGRLSVLWPKTPLMRGSPKGDVIDAMA